MKKDTKDAFIIVVNEVTAYFTRTLLEHENDRRQAKITPVWILVFKMNWVGPVKNGNTCYINSENPSYTFDCEVRGSFDSC